METIQPYQTAIDLLLALGIKFSAIYNDNGGIKRDQLMILSIINPRLSLKPNAYETIARLSKSKNPDIKWNNNIKNTLVGTLSSALMEQFKTLPPADRRKIKIKWLPSTAREEDAVHALYYGKTMTLEKAIKLGLGTRYGCQCRYQVVAGQKEHDQVTKQFTQELKR